MTTAINPRAKASAKAPESKRQTASGAAMAVVSFDKQLKHARELVTEGRRLLHAANRNLSVGSVLVRRSHQRLTDTEAYFRRTRPVIRPAGR